MSNDASWQLTPEDKELRERPRLAREGVQDAETFHIHDEDQRNAEYEEAVKAL